MPCEDEGRDQSDASTSQRMPKIASKPPGAKREARNSSFPSTFRGSMALLTP